MPDCLCGCGEAATSRFRPGHDARLKSRLFSAARLGDKAAEATIVEMGWLHLYDKNAPKPPAGKTIKQQAAAVRAAQREARPERDPDVTRAKADARREAEAEVARATLERLALMKAAAAIMKQAYNGQPRPQVNRYNAQQIVDIGPDLVRLQESLGVPDA